MPNDLLRMDYINSLPQPLTANYLGLEWPVDYIGVDVGLVRIDACGKPTALRMGDIKSFTDAAGIVHDPETFYSIED